MQALQLGIWGGIFQVFYLVLVIVAAAFLIRLYLRTRASGIWWLLAAVIVVPAIGRIAAMFLPFVIVAHAYPAETAALLNVILFGLLSVIEASLLLVAALLLDRQLVSSRGGMPPVTPASWGGTP